MIKKISCIFIATMLICDASFTYAQQTDDDYQLVFSDEFNQHNES
jgi:hypothetical protein